jgi:hypothetical protein
MGLNIFSFQIHDNSHSYGTAVVKVSNLRFGNGLSTVFLEHKDCELNYVPKLGGDSATTARIISWTKK